MDYRALLALVDAHTQARQSVVTRTVEGVSQLTGSVGQWGNPEQILTYTTRAGLIIGAGQVAVANLVEAYLARTAAIITGEAWRALPVAADMAATRRILPLGQGWNVIYNRVATEYRVALAATGDRDQAFYLANLRARRMAETDLGLAFRDQVDLFMRGRRNQRGYLFAYRRVIRPELSGGNVCGLCVAASDRLYYRGDLMPIHSGCNCGVMLVTRQSDPAVQMNREELDALYREAGGTDYQSLRRTKYVVHENGELGPVLWKADNHFRGPAEVAATR